jgi:hypothetical protein
MARFRSIGAIVIGDHKYVAGTVFVDAPGAMGQAPGDVLWPGGLTKWNVGPNLIPLDSGAQSMMAASRFANEVSWPSCGASSVG